MSSSEPAIIAVKHTSTTLPFLKLAGHSIRGFAQGNRPLRLNHLPELSRLTSALEFRRGSHKCGIRIVRRGSAAGIEHLQGLVPQVLIVAFAQVVDTDQKGVVHYTELLQEPHVLLKLTHEKLLFLDTQLEMPFPAEPVEVLQCGAGVLSQVLFFIVSSYRRTLQVESRVNVPVGRK